MMENAFDELSRAMDQARAVDDAVGRHANAMADLLIPNLGKVSTWRLTRMKKALRNFNMHTGEWRKP